MIDGSSGVVQDVWKAFTLSPLGQALVWGGIGGLVAWWSIADEDRQHALKKQILLGSLVASGTGSLGTLALKAVFGVEMGAVAAAGIGPIAFFMGVFGPAFITMKLRQISGRERTTQEERPDD